MLGALSGAVGAANGPQSGSESRISSSILPLNSVAIAGLTLVVDPGDSGCRLHRCAKLSANIALTNSHAAAMANEGLSGRLLTGLRHMVIRVRPRLLMQQRDTGDHVVSARRRAERVVTARTDQACDTNGDSQTVDYLSNASSRRSPSSIDTGRRTR